MAPALWIAAGLGGYALFYVVTWIFYLAVMSLDRQDKTGVIAKPARYTGYGVLAVGLVLDFLGNVGLSVILWELPKETTITSRITRLIESPNSTASPKRRAIALWIRTTWLDGFDRRGIHRS